MTTTSISTPKKNNIKGPIRTEAVMPFVLVCVVTWGYFHFLFDHNLKAGLEFAGYHAIGAEVNIVSLETSFWRASFRAQGISVTNAEKPQFDVIKIGDVRYSLLWDGLLRARFIVNEVAVEQIEFNIPRKAPGKVKPPEPPANDSTPSALSKESDKIKNQVTAKAQKELAGNIFGDIATLLSGGNSQEQLSNLENSLPSKIKLKEIEIDFKSKQTKWNEKMKAIPQGKDLQILSEKLGKVKTKDFKSPQELQQSLQEIDGIFKEADTKFKQVQGLSEDFNKDMKTLQDNYKELDMLVKKDIQALEAKFKIPKLDAKSLTMGVFHQYMDPYMVMFNRYKGLAEKYVPPNLLKKATGEKSTSEEDDSIKPHPRARGVTYEFGRPHAYPLFWIKRISISSQAGLTKESGNLHGEITDITSNQKMIGKPTIANLEGGFPGMEISGLQVNLKIDVMGGESKIDYLFNIESYSMVGKDVVRSPEIQIAFKKAEGRLKSSGTLLGLRDFQFNLDNSFQKIDYQIDAKNEQVKSLLTDVFKGISLVTLSAKGAGELPDLPLNLYSNIGQELSKGFEVQLQKRINEAKQKLQNAIDEAIGKEKSKLEVEIKKIKSQYEGELKKASDQINNQKLQAQTKIDQTKKEAETQGKKKIEQEGKKLLDDLKGKFGL